MAMRKAARAPSDCIKTRDLPVLDLDWARRSPFTVHCHVGSQCWYWAARHLFRLLAEIPEIFLVAAVIWSVLILTCRRLAYISHPAYIGGGDPGRTQVSLRRLAAS